MCFQGFVEYACQHQEIFEETCELSYGNPFFMKAGCENYRTAKQIVTSACGLGQFYCKQTPDGSFLEQVHVHHRHLQQQKEQVVARMQHLSGLWYRFTMSANHAGVSLEDRKKHPAYNKLLAHNQQTGSLLHHVNLAQQYDKLAINHGLTYMKQRVQHVQTHGAAAPFREFSLPVDLVAKLPAELQMHPVAQRSRAYVPFGRPVMAVTAESIDASNHDPFQTQVPLPAVRSRPHHPPGRPPLPQQVSNVTESGREFKDSPLQDMVGPGPPSKKSRRTIGHGPQPPAKLPRRKPSVPSTKVELPQEEESSLRRSSRVRNKVSYAETEGSSSRDPSPAKSELSTFSPPKSDESLSPLKDQPIRPSKRARDGTLRPTSSSLGDIIGEWKKKATKHPIVKDDDHESSPQLKVPVAYAQPSLPRLPSSYQTATPLSEQKPRPDGQPSVQLQSPFSMKRNNNHNSNPSFQPVMGRSLPDLQAQGMESNIFHQYAQRSMGAVPIGTAYHHRYSGLPYGNLPNALQPNQNGMMNNTAPVGFVRPPSGQVSESVDLPAPNANVSRAQSSDSGIGFPPMPEFKQTASDISANSTYEKMRRSFGAAADLTPQALASNTLVNTDPKKRDAPASSPSLPPAKRVRLSLPGENPASETHDVSTSNESTLVSPSKVRAHMAQEIYGDTQDTKATIADASGIAPAPVLSPSPSGLIKGNAEDLTLGLSWDPLDESHVEESFEFDPANLDFGDIDELLQRELEA